MCAHVCASNMCEFAAGNPGQSVESLIYERSIEISFRCLAYKREARDSDYHKYCLKILALYFFVLCRLFYFNAFFDVKANLFVTIVHDGVSVISLWLEQILKLMR